MLFDALSNYKLNGLCCDGITPFRSRVHLVQSCPLECSRRYVERFTHNASTMDPPREPADRLVLNWKKNFVSPTSHTLVRIGLLVAMNSQTQ